MESIILILSAIFFLAFLADKPNKEEPESNHYAFYKMERDDVDF